MNKLSTLDVAVGVAAKLTTNDWWASALRLLFLRVVIVSAVALVTTEASATGPNVLVNGDFENNPPPNLGNNIGWPIPPWVLGTSGQTSNVVKVDGVYNYGTNGPWLDASGSAVSVKRHYLDIANGSNDFYQSFTPQCSGEVDFGGFFSTRANLPGTASVRIVQGVGTGGPVIGATNTISLPGGNSAHDPWTPVSFTVNVTAFTTYSFVVQMDNNMNFDEGFVRYRIDCGSTPTPTPTPTSTPPTPTPTSTPCAQVTGEARCLPNGGYSYTFTVTNNSGSVMSQILLTPDAGSTFTLSPQLTDLPAPLQNSQSTIVTTNISNIKPGDKVCFFMSLMSDKAPCCTTQVCPTLPRCGVIETVTPPPSTRQQRPPLPSRRGKRRP
jgi:hypothetical protein